MLYIPDLARMIPATFLIIMWFFVVLRAYSIYNRHNLYNTALKRSVLSVTLAILSLLALTSKPTNLFLRSIALTIMPLALMVDLCATQFYLGVAIVSEKRISLIISTLCLLTIIFDVMRGENTGSFIDNEIFVMSISYFLHNLCFFLNLMVASASLMMLKIRALYQHYNDFIDLRIFCGLIGHTCGCIATLIMLIDLIMTLFDPVLHAISIILFHILVVANAIFVCLALSSDQVFQPVSYPFAHWIRKYKDRQRQKIETLHEIITTIVPIVQLPLSRFKEKRLLVEISHARRIIWSHHDLPGSLSPKEEIGIIANLFQRNVTYEQAGPYRPPPKLETPQTYFTKLADHLHAQKGLAMNAVSIPQIDGIPLLGNLLDFRNKRLELLQRTSRTCGDIGVFFLANKPVVIINEVQMIQEAFVDQAYNLSKPSNVRRYMRPIFDRSLYLLEGDEHRSRRKLLAPFFQHRQMNGYVETVTRAVTRAQQHFFDETIINVHDEMFRLALAIAAEIVFSVDLLSGSQPIREAATFITHYISDNLSTLFPIPPEWPTPRNRQYHQAIKILDETLQQIIGARQSDSTESVDILHVLLNTQTLSQEDVRGEALNLLLAGHETTTDALAWIWYLLGQHPEIYQRVQSEVDNVLGKRVLQADDLSKMSYINQVIHESLRLYPPTYIIPRKTISEVRLSAGYVIPPETRVIVSPYTLHRRSDYFEDPETFNPDRFSPEREQQIRKYSYLPFSTGPNTCMGMHFAMLEMQIALITTLQHVRLEPLPGQQVTPQPFVTLRPSPFSMRVVRRS